jgi:hypothetical protein
MNDYDLHLAAASISPKSVSILGHLGFVRDEFANLTYCHTGDYHGTFRGSIRLPNKDLWNKVCDVLESDEQFSGYMEEELTVEDWRGLLHGDGGVSDPAALPPLAMITCPVGRKKACDIHMAVYLDSSTPATVELMAGLQASSVDRPGPEGIRRVYTVTCELLADGKRLYSALYSYLLCVRGLRGRMKLEVTTKHYRKPADAVTLPLATTEGIAAWFKDCREAGLNFSGRNLTEEKRELVHA